MSIIQECVGSTMKQMAAGKEELIKRAIDGLEPDWTIAAILPRLTREVHVPGNVEVFKLDGKPIIEFYPIEVGEPERRDGHYIQEISQRYRVLSDQSTAGSAGGAP